MASQPGSTARLDVLQTFDFKGEDYQNLIQDSIVTAFQSGFWLNAIYQNLAGNVSAEPVIVTARDVVDNRLLMVLPLLRQSAFGRKIIQPADLGISDYNCVIGQTRDLERLAADPAVRAKMRELLKPFDLLLFRKQRPETFDVERFFDGTVRLKNSSAGHDLSMPDGFDVWRSENLSKSTHKGLARKRRNFCKEVGELSFRVAETSEEINSAFRFLREERGRKYPDDLLSRKAYFNFYLKAATDGAASGEAVTFIGEAGGRIMTVDFGLYRHGQHLMILGAFKGDEIYKRYSLGLQGILELMHTRCNLGIMHFDFTIGDEEYKESFGTKRVGLSTIAITNGIAGKFGLLVYRYSSQIKGLVKRLSPDVN